MEVPTQSADLDFNALTSELCALGMDNCKNQDPATCNLQRSCEATSAQWLSGHGKFWLHRRCKGRSEALTSAMCDFRGLRPEVPERKSEGKLARPERQ